MINQLSERITNYIKINSDIKNEDRLAEIDYASQAIFNEVFKTVTLTVLFLLLGRLNYFLFSLCILISIRIFAGGYHSITTLRCLLFSITFFLITSWLGPTLPKLNIFIYYLISILSIITVILNAPFPNKKRPIKSKKRRFTLKIISIFFTTIWTITLLFYIKDPSYLNCGFLTIILQTIQIIYIKKEYNHEKTIEI